MKTAIVAIIVLGFLVFVHEFGHFLAAKLSGMRVEEFSIGMGPTIYSVQKGETKYNLGLLPIGGYVRVTGQYAEEFDDGVLAADDPRRYPNRPLWHRFIFVAAGSVMNFITAIVLFTGLFLYIGIPVLDQNADTVVSAVVEQGPAAEAGMQSGDKVLSINGQAVETWQELTAKIEQSGGTAVELVVERDGRSLTLTMAPEYDEEAGRMLLGIQKNATKKAGLLTAAKLGAQETWQITLQLVDAVGNLVTGQVSIADDEEGLTGPVGIFKIIDDTAKAGLIYVINLMAVLSINLGLLNILPIPALDGSKLVFLAIEGIKGSPVSPSKENFVHFIGFALLMMLMIFITYKDILRLFS